MTRLSPRALALAACPWLMAAAMAGPACDSYWPLNAGDSKTFRYGTKTLAVSVANYLGDEYQVSFTSDEDSGSEVHKKAADGIYLTKVKSGWISVYFDPDVLLLDDTLLANGGSRSTKTTVSQSGVHYPATFTVRVSKAGTVTVPAGTFLDCRNVTVSEVATVPGQGTVSATAMTAVLAPRAGMIKKLIKPGVWSVLESGTVGGVDVRDLAGVVSGTLQVQVIGNGKVTPDYEGQTLAVGKTYTVTAVPDAGYIFSHWAGNVTGSNPKLAFVMQKDMVLEAHFVPNPFMAVKGSYSGLVAEANGVSPRSSGSVQVTVTDKGKYTAVLMLAGKRYSLSGQFDASGKATASPAGSGFSLSLQLDMTSGTDRLSGSVSSSSWAAAVDANRAVFDGKAALAFAAGQYTVVITGADASAALPGGDGYATATIDKAGKIRFAGSLADGTKVSQSATLSKNGEWPLYVPLAGGGLLMSWVTLSSSASADLLGDTAWVKPAVAGSKYYAGGFSFSTVLSGSRYSVPGAGTNVLGLLEAAVLFSGGNLSAPLSRDLVLDPAGKITNLKSADFTLVFAKSTGLFSGRVAVPGARTPIAFKGAVLQKQKSGAGYFLGTNQSGSVRIGPKP